MGSIPVAGQGSGPYMLIAFAVGFWGIWSANRDMKSLSESLVIIIIAIATKALMDWSGMPEFDSQLLTIWGLLYVYLVVIFELVNRFSGSMASNLIISVGGAIGYFGLSRYLFSEAGMAMVKGWLA